VVKFTSCLSINEKSGAEKSTPSKNQEAKLKF